MKWVFLLIAGFCILCSCQHNSENKNDFILRLKYKKGDKQSITSSVSSKGEATTITYTTGITFMIDSVPGDSLYNISGKVNYITLVQGGDPHLAMRNYDSRRSEENMSDDDKRFHQVIKPMLDSVIRLQMNSRGEITGGYTFKGYVSMFGLKQPATDINNSRIVFPLNPVKSGTTWTVEKRNVFRNNDKVTSRYEIEQADSSIIHILSNEVEETPGYGQNTRSAGKFEVDRMNGRVRNATIETETNTVFGTKEKVTISVRSYY